VGDAYGISFEDGRWIAIPRDAVARVLTGDTPDALNLTLRADLAREEASDRRGGGHGHRVQGHVPRAG
jgi:hypothetical protein